MNVFVYDGAMVPDPEGIITAGHDNKPALLAMLRQIIANNKAGGWRRLQREGLPNAEVT